MADFYVAPGTLIQTSKGLKPVEDIQPGDIVVTHTNKTQKITDTYKADKLTNT